jgi:hypothetical protein
VVKHEFHVETKEQSKEWMHTNSPNKPKKSLNKRLPAKKLMTTVFWTGNECKHVIVEI